PPHNQFQSTPPRGGRLFTFNPLYHLLSFIIFREPKRYKPKDKLIKLQTSIKISTLQAVTTSANLPGISWQLMVRAPYQTINGPS
ncbi:MAG: hypothetical protein AB1545_13330, partial [Thermodesulfobacteriota bacterium]